MTLRLLVPSIGRKRDLATLLRAALSTTGGVLFGADSDASATAMRDVDVPVDLPDFGTDGFWDRLDGAVRQHAIDAVLPVRDAELVDWAKRSEAGLLPVASLVPASETLAICRDKSRLYALAGTVGIACPAWSVGPGAGAAVRFPCVLKPVKGSGSRGVRTVDGPGTLRSAIADAGEPLMIQAWRHGTEYSVDCLADRDGTLLDCCIRERRVVEDGQSVAGAVIDDPELAGLCARLAHRMLFRGVFNVQFIRDAEGPWLIDLNPRFPGGIAITERAGCGYVAQIVEMLVTNAAGRECARVGGRVVAPPEAAL